MFAKLTSIVFLLFLVPSAVRANDWPSAEAESLYAEAAEALNCQDFSDAHALLSSILEMHPELDVGSDLGLHLRMRLARIAVMSEDWQGAVRAYEVVLEAHPDLLLARRFYARTLEATGRSDEAAIQNELIEEALTQNKQEHRDRLQRRQREQPSWFRPPSRMIDSPIGIPRDKGLPDKDLTDRNGRQPMKVDFKARSAKYAEVMDELDIKRMWQKAVDLSSRGEHEEALNKYHAMKAKLENYQGSPDQEAAAKKILIRVDFLIRKISKKVAAGGN